MEKRESESVEFKKSTSELKQGIISLSSMLNKSGHGKLYFGVLNDSTICGQQIGQDTTYKISVEIKNFIRPTIVPTIELKEESGKQYIVITVTGTDAPYSAYGRYYIRSDDEDLLMDDHTMQKLFENKEIDYSKWENTLTSYSLEVIDEERLIRYFNEANDCGRLNYIYKDPQDALIKLGLLKDGKLNNAGLYLFSNIKPIKLKLAQFNSDERLSFSDIRLFEGNIFDCIDEGIRYISNAMNWRGEIIGTKRIETPEIPLEAIREIVVNSFAHMKVIPGVLNKIYLTPSIIRIVNPGNIALGIDPKDFADGKKGPVLRNPLIDLTLYKNGTIDSFATGFNRTFKLCNDKNIKYAYESDDISFSFTFYRTKDSFKDSKDTEHEAINEAISEATNEAINQMKQKKIGEDHNSRKSKILSKLRNNPTMTREELAKELQASQSTIYRELKELQNENLITRAGSKKMGFWQVMEDENKAK